MFDSVWQRRHGALLGILALLKAWRKTLWEEATDDAEEGKYFGPWPEDIFARSLCLLALDRFGDFSGAVAETKDDDRKGHDPRSEQTMSSRTASSGVVAPIRELGAQLFSLLWRMAPLSLQVESISLLRSVLDTTEDWEAMHGSLLALKYITIIASMDSSKLEMSEKKKEWFCQCLDSCGGIAGRFLSSSNHDVSGVAARILCEHNMILLKQESILLTLWTVVRSIDVMASCVTDMVALLSAFIKTNPQQGIASLGKVTSLQQNEISQDLIRTLLHFLRCPFASVRIAALSSLDLLSFLQGGMIDVEGKCSMYREIMRILFQCYVGLVDEMSLLSEDDSTETEAVLTQLDMTWDSYIAFANSVKVRSPETMRLATLDVLEQYYGSADILSRPSRYHLLMGSPCTALSNFIQKHLSGVSIVEDLLLFSFRIYLSSPWIYHCEMACSLLQKLCHDDALRLILNELRPYINNLFEKPLCLQVTKSVGCSILDSKEMKQKHSALAKAALLEGTNSPNRGSFIEFSTSEMKRLLFGEGYDIKRDDSGVPVLERMRLRAVVASAALALGLETKITPCVRALMTSIKNETSDFRLSETSSALSRFLVSNHDHNSTRTKIINSLSSVACAKGASESRASFYAAKTINTYLSQLSEKELKSVVPKIHFHASVQNPDAASAMDVDKALVFLCSLFRSIDNPACVDYFIDNYVETLCRLSLCGSQERKRLARSCLRSLCGFNGRGLEVAFPFAADLVEQEKTDSDVLNGIVLLKDLCELSPQFLGPFVKMLLPLALRAMTNPDRSISQIANGIFAILVRVAPLVSEYPELPASGSSGHGDQHTSLVLDHLIRGKKLPRMTLPDEIDSALRKARVDLRDYQLEGIAWISFLLSVNLNGALCDSMGLGKTIQALVGIALAHLQNASSNPISVVVCPATIVNHWVGEVRRFFPGDDLFRPRAAVGDLSTRRLFWSTLNPSEHNLVVVSYGTLRSDISQIEKRKWTFCVLDEVHVLRNPKTSTARASRRIPSRHRMVLSGTMIQNKVLDVWATFDFLMPNFLGSSREFTKTYARPITKSQLPGASADSINEGLEKLKILHQQVLPFILRREKQQVLTELPPKHITDLVCPLSHLQRRLYDMFAASEEAKESLALFERNLEPENQNYGSHVLRVLLFLRLICTHPSLIDTRQRGDGSLTANGTHYHLSSSGKFLTLFNLLRDCGVSEDGFMAGDNDESFIYCDGEDTDISVNTERKDSESALRVDEAPLDPVSSVSETNGRTKCLIFAQFSQTLDAVEDYLFKPHMPSTRYLRLDGSVAAEHRVEVANRFNNDHSISILLLTTRVGSLGLNLCSASIVVFIEHDFNPFVDEQAMDRVHRIGQRADSINVYRLIAEDSIDERIMDMQRKKIAVSEAVINTENSTLYSMGTDRLLDIFTPNFSSNKDEPPQDLEAILTHYAQNYKTLSVDEFIRNFQ